MYQFNQCPRCGAELEAERFMHGTVVCQCGWTKSLRNESAERRNIDRICTSIVLIAALLIGAFLQAVNWDKYFFTIMPLKVKQYANMASVSDLKSIVNICEERKKLDCMESAYQQLIRIDSKNPVHLADLGLLLVKREKWTQAADAFARYFALKGKDPEAAVAYAQTLSRLKKYAEAEKYFRFVLGAHANLTQVTVARSYVLMLIEANRLQAAKEIILSFRKKSATASLFMAKELGDIRQKLGEVETAATSNY